MTKGFFWGLFVSVFITVFAFGAERDLQPAIDACTNALSVQQRELLVRADGTWDYSAQVLWKEVDGASKIVVLLRDDAIKYRKNLAMGDDIWKAFPNRAVESNNNKGLAGAQSLQLLMRIRQFLGKSWITKRKVAHRLTQGPYKQDAGGFEIPIDLEKNWKPSRMANVGSVMGQSKAYLTMLVATAGLVVGLDQLYLASDFIYQNLHAAHFGQIPIGEITSPLAQLGVYDIASSVQGFEILSKVNAFRKSNPIPIALGTLLGFQILRRGKVLDYYPPFALSKEKAQSMAATLDETLLTESSEPMILAIMDGESGARVSRQLTESLGYQNVPIHRILGEADPIKGNKWHAKVRRKYRDWRIRYQTWIEKKFGNYSDSE